MKTTTTVLGLILALVPPLFGALGSSAQPRIRWYAVNGELSDKGQSLNLSFGVQRIVMRGGWSCEVRPPSAPYPSHEARTTVCSGSRGEGVRFVVQCDDGRPKEDRQVGLMEDGREVDYIEVGCELR